MLAIKEEISKNLGCFTSLFIYLDKVDTVKSSITNIIKSTGTYYYDEKTGLWEVPISFLSYLVNECSYFDDIQVELLSEINNTPEEIYLNTHKNKLLDYQEDGVKYGLEAKKFLLLDAPGLGKTIQILYLAEELKERYNIEHVLIICGVASLRANWENEIKKHTNLSYRVIGKHITKNKTVRWAPISERIQELNSVIDEFFIVINVESLRDAGILKAIQSGPNKYGLMVIDEIHKCKNAESLQTSNLLQLHADFKVGATGTLIENTPIDCYVPLVWIEKQRRKFLTKFKNTYCIFDLNTKGRIVASKNLDILREMISSCSLRRKKDLLKLPPKNFIDEYLTMDSAQDKFYTDITNAVKKEYKELAVQACDKINLKTSSLLALITRLRQATSCPSILTTQNIPSCKIERCVDLVEEIISSGEKVVVMSSFKATIHELEQRLSEYNPLVATGETNDEATTIELFQTDDAHKIFLGTIQKIGTGFTLNKASYMIFIDQLWTDSSYLQATDRIYRIGTDKPVFIYNLMCDNTIDVAVANVLKKKRELSDYLVDGKVSDSTKDMLLDMFSSVGVV